jgi:hypothetical protein
MASSSGLAQADEQSDATAILDAAIKAHGGEAALGKPVGFYGKLKGTEYEKDANTPISDEMYVTSAKQRIVTLDSDGKAAEIEVVNGKEGWVKEGDMPTEKMTDDQLKSGQDSVYQNWTTTVFLPLKEKEFRLSMLPEADVAGHKAVGILVRDEKHTPMKLYFDKETHLLAKLQSKAKDTDSGKEYDVEVIYSDYRDVQETKQPFALVVNRDGVKNFEYDVTEMKLTDKPMDASLFEKP